VATTVLGLPLLGQSKSYFVHSTSQCGDISQVQLDWLSGQRMPWAAIVSRLAACNPIQNVECITVPARMCSRYKERQQMKTKNVPEFM